MQKKLLVHVFYKSKKYNIEESNYQKKKKKEKRIENSAEVSAMLKNSGLFHALLSLSPKERQYYQQ